MARILDWLAGAFYWLVMPLWRSLRRGQDPLRLAPPAQSNWTARDTSADESLAAAQRQI